MEFLKELEKSLAAGLTKEQFIDIWNTESKVKDIGDGVATVVGHNMHKTSSDFQRLEECNRSFLSNFRLTCNQLLDKQEQQWKQLQHKHDQMMEEVRSRFSLLSSHISNVVDCNTNSMKIYVMQELSLFQQELPQMIHELRTNHGCGTDRCKIPTDNQELSTNHGCGTDRCKIPTDNQELSTNHECDTGRCKISTDNQELSINHGCGTDMSKISTESQGLTSVKISGCRTFEASSKENEFKADGQSKYAKPQELLGTVHQQIYPSDLDAYQQPRVQNGIPTSIDVSERGEKTITPPNDVECINEKLDSNTNATIDDDVYRNIHNMALTISGCNSESNQCTNAESAETKVSNAQASQRKQSSHLSMSSPGSVNLHGSRSSSSSRTDNTGTPTQPVPTLPAGSQKFTATVSQKNCVFQSPAMYSSGVPCLATFQGHFDAKGALNIALHIRSSSYDGNHKWPLFLSGTGYLFHRASKRYTSVWQVAPTTCQKPLSTNGAFVFSCAVCLTTSRGTYPNVTYKQLVSSGFIENNALIMKCTLSARTSPSKVTSSPVFVN